ncbi:hypothetical protein AB6A40_008622 [Gnathostoma spinigerum]|uniref:Equilibrative nucleoside transporter 3 n=1 Tax=Gnathostoma spinigerum TaxID=75299 RepID=A0ABD6EXW0_9BILA
MLAVEKEAPRDRYNIVYYIMLLHGVGTLMPWNMFITIAPSYFVDYKLKEVGTDGVLIGTTYSLNFFSYLGICSQLPNLLTNLANVFIRSKGGLGRRIILSLITVALIIIITLVLVFIDTSHIVTTFFFLTMLTVIVLNAANGIYQNSIYGVVAAFPQQFTNAIVLGNNVCGTFVSIINIITLTALETVQIAASAYFLIALLTVTTCLVTFILLPRFEFYRYYMKKAEEEKEVVNLNEGESTTKVMLYWEVFKQVWVQCLNVFLVFFVTLSIFPAIMADTRIYRPNGVYDFWLPGTLNTCTTFSAQQLLVISFASCSMNNVNIDHFHSGNVKIFGWSLLMGGKWFALWIA